MNEGCIFAVSVAERFFEMIETKHPGGKRGIQIPEKIYQNIAGFIVQVISREDRPNLLSLLHQAEVEFPALSNLNLLVYHVKLDLEAKGLIKTVRSREAETIRLRLTSQGIRKNRQKVF
jgi:hypothetical protein